MRTITMGISLLDCIDSSVEKVCENVYNKITTLAKNLVSTGKDIEKEYGIDCKQANQRNANRACRQCSMQDNG